MIQFIDSFRRRLHTFRRTRWATTKIYKMLVLITIYKLKPENANLASRKMLVHNQLE